MKKFVFALTAVLLAGALLTSASPSLDGRAVVAEAGMFPRGYFAKTVGYLPGDSLKVTNPVNGDRIDILVIGSLDASDGVAILLSPEAAEALSIRKNSNNIVKLTKRSGTADEVASGSALITNDGESEEVAEAESHEEQDIIDHVETLAEADGEEDGCEGPSVAEAEETPPAATEDNIADELAEAEPSADEEGDENIPEETLAEADGDEDDGIYTELVLEDGIPEDGSEAHKIPEEYVVADDDLSDKEAKSPEYEYVEADDIPDDIDGTAALAERVDNEIPEEKAAEEATGEKVAAEDVPPDDGEYDAIVLVPSDENPPEPSEHEKEEVSALAEEATKKSEEFAAPSTELVPRNYYVQIAVYSEAENVDEVNRVYGNRYPLVVLENGRRKTVMVGPFGVDEYGIILERFKAYGFKDAFVKSTF